MSRPQLARTEPLAVCQPPNKQLQRTVTLVAGAAHVRHFIPHTRGASHGSARSLNCGVRREAQVVAIFTRSLVELVGSRSCVCDVRRTDESHLSLFVQRTCSSDA